MSTIRAAIIGVGKPRKTEGATGFAMGDKHAAGYLACPDCELVAVADLSEENAKAFAERHSQAKPALYTDYKQMVSKEKPDIVSVCLWIDLHRPVVLDLIAAGTRAIHCEKPMASTFGECRQMVQAADAAKTQLTFNHQRRFGKAFQEAKRIAHSGAIGAIKRLEGSCSNMFDWGTHWFDMMFYFHNETPAEWVIGQIDAREVKTIFGVRIEDQGIAQFRFRDGVAGLLATGPQGSELIGSQLRIVGDKGAVELDAADMPKGMHLRVRGAGDGDWRYPQIEGTLHGDEMFVAAIRDVVDSLRAGRASLLDCHNALRASELIFGTYESSRRRARVDFPLAIEDSPLLSMLDAGLLGK